MNLENQRNNKNRISTISLLQHITTIGTVALFSSYFFTRGYIHSFNLPIQVDFLESGYFMLTLIADRIFPLIFSVFTNIWFLIIVLTIFINSKFKFLKFKGFYKFRIIRYIDDKWKNTKNLTPLRFLLYFIICIFILKHLLDLKLNPFRSLKENLSFSKLHLGKCTSLGNLLGKSKYEIFLCEVKLFFLDKLEFFLTRFPESLKTWTFFIILIIIIFSIPLFINLFIKKENFFKTNFAKNFFIFLSVCLISASSSYFFGHKHLWKLARRYEYRVDTKTKEKRVQIWKESNYYFYVNCKQHGVSFIKGENKNDKVFYVSYLNKRKHPSVSTP